MTAAIHAAWDARVEYLLTKLPARLRDAVHWLRHPPRKPLRLLASAFFIMGGVLSILPILGLWMLPLGFMLLTDDFPALKTPLEISAAWTARQWRRLVLWWRSRR